MKKVFLDSSVVFKLLRRHIVDEWLTTSKLLNLSWYVYYVSDFVVAEILRNLKNKYWIAALDYIEEFLSDYKINYQETIYIYQDYSEYVKDLDDEKIVCWAIESGCTILLTNNIKDFECEKIKQELWIEVRSYLE